MFDGNWFLFLLIILILFAGDDGIDRTESLVLIGIVAALLCSEGEDIDIIDEEG
ncbi:MAG: hypothetical protein ACOX3U_04675 [Christensenellales bacterium]|jgi:hypothetical protein